MEETATPRALAKALARSVDRYIERNPKSARQYERAVQVFFHMLEHGVYLARRGFVVLS